MAKPGYSSHSIDDQLKQELLRIGQHELADKLGIVPTVPAVIRYLVKHYEQSTPKKGKK